jgi:hypothetical protein
MPAKTKARKSGTRSRPSSKKKTEYWTHEVSENSSVMDLEPGLMNKRTAREIALSIKRSADRSDRLKATPFRSAMSMLTFLINRAGTNLTDAQRKKLEDAKVELRNLYGHQEVESEEVQGRRHASGGNGRGRRRPTESPEDEIAYGERQSVSARYDEEDGAFEEGTLDFSQRTARSRDEVEDVESFDMTDEDDDTPGKVRGRDEEVSSEEDEDEDTDVGTTLDRNNGRTLTITHPDDVVGRVVGKKAAQRASRARTGSRSGGSARGQRSESTSGRKKSAGSMGDKRTGGASKSTSGSAGRSKSKVKSSAKRAGRKSSRGR